MNFSLFLNILNFNNQLKSQFCVDCQYNKIKNEMNVLLLIIFFRVQIIQFCRKTFFIIICHWMHFVNFFFCKKLHFIIYFETFVSITYNLFDCDWVKTNSNIKIFFKISNASWHVTIHVMNFFIFFAQINIRFFQKFK